MPLNGTKKQAKNPQSRGRVYRVRTGCLTCRARKKKCDERKPTCVGCERNRLSCKWPVHVLMDEPPVPNISRAQGIGSKGQGLSSRCEDLVGQTLKENSAVRDPDFRPGVSSHVVPELPLRPTPSSLLSSLGGGVSAQNDNLPSLSTSLPRQDNSVGLNSSALEKSDEDIWLQHMSTTSNPASIATSPSLFSNLTPTSYLLGHYLQTTADNLSNGASPLNPFLAYMMPLALSSDLIHHLILTQSASHRAQMIQSGSDNMSQEYYSKAIKLYRHSISNYLVRQDISPLLLAVGALSLGFIEVYGNPFSIWVCLTDQLPGHPRRYDWGCL